MNDSDELSALRGVNLQLQGTVASLRSELEEAAMRGRAQVQTAEARAANEIADLRRAIDSLRQALDNTASAGRADTQAEKARAAAEAQQLRSSVDALRTEMDSLRAAHQSALTRQESTDRKSVV